MLLTIKALDFLVRVKLAKAVVTYKPRVCEGNGYSMSRGGLKDVLDYELIELMSQEFVGLLVIFSDQL